MIHRVSRPQDDNPQGAWLGGSRLDWHEPTESWPSAGRGAGDSDIHRARAGAYWAGAGPDGLSRTSTHKVVRGPGDSAVTPPSLERTGGAMTDEAIGRWARRTGDSLRSWWDQGAKGTSRSSQGRQSPGPSARAPADPDGPMGPLTFAGSADPWPEMLQFTSSGDARWRMVYGAYGNMFVASEPRSHLLILGPPRVNKTAGVLIPLVLSAPGPVVSSSTRDDVLRACAATRSRMGRIWHFTPDGSPTAPGAIPLRWSPLTTNWRQAKRFALAFLGTAESSQGEGRNARYFTDQATRLVAPTIMAAALAGKTMKWATKILVSQDSEFYVEVQDILADHPDAPGAENALDALSGIMAMSGSHGSGTDIYATAARAFEVYNDPDVIDATEPANFDPAAFVAGQPDVINPGRFATLDRQLATSSAAHLIEDRLPRGMYDTIFITADAESHEAVAPIIVGLLSALHLSAQRQAQADQARGFNDRPPMLWALDEVANMAPWPRFPKVLATCAGSNVLVAAVFQDLAQATAKWKEEAKGLRTLFRQTVVFPGIENAQTLREISDSLGKHWVTTWNENYGTNTGQQTSNSTGHSQNQQYLSILEPGDIARGHPEDPTAVLSLTPGKHVWVHPMPYYSTPPWAEVMVGSLLFLDLKGDISDPRLRLPVPSLDRDGGAHLARWRAPEQVSALVQAIDQHRTWQQNNGFGEASPETTPEDVSSASSYQGVQLVEFHLTKDSNLDDFQAMFGQLQRGAPPAEAAPAHSLGDGPLDDDLDGPLDDDELTTK